MIHSASTDTGDRYNRNMEEYVTSLFLLDTTRLEMLLQAKASMEEELKGKQGYDLLQRRCVLLINDRFIKDEVDMLHNKILEKQDGYESDSSLTSLHRYR